MKKITLSIKNALNTPTNRLHTIGGIVSGIAIILFADKIDATTIGGAIFFALTGIFAGEEQK